MNVTSSPFNCGNSENTLVSSNILVSCEYVSSFIISTIEVVLFLYSDTILFFFQNIFSSHSFEISTNPSSLSSSSSLSLISLFSSIFFVIFIFFNKILEINSLICDNGGITLGYTLSTSSSVSNPKDVSITSSNHGSSHSYSDFILSSIIF